VRLAAVAAPAAVALACSPGRPAANGAVPSQSGIAAPGSPPTAATARLKLPTYQPASGPQPDLPATANGADAAFFSFPRALTRSVDSTPAHGGQLTSLVLLTQTPPAPMEQNAAWQEINRQLGLTANLLMVTGADYPTRLNTIVASGDLPDLLFNVQQYLPNAAEFMTRQCADLTPYLSGDAIKEYPNLATFPTLAWKSTIFNDRLYAVPIPRSVMGTTMITRQDLLDAAGAQHPKTASSSACYSTSPTRRAISTASRPSAPPPLA
jgi:putative aldouronate transport system substrate-binding protein